MATSRIIHQEFYSSAADWYSHIANIAAEKSHPEVSRCSSNSISEGREDFYGSSNATEALRLATLGWPEGREYMAETLSNVKAIMKPATERFMALDVGGMYPFVPAAIAGDPACMVTIGEQDTKTRPIVRIISEQWGSCGVEKKQLINRGAAILAHIDRLESAGIRVELVARFSCAATDDSKANMVIDVLAKRADEPLEIDRLAFLLVHPSALRRFFFRQQETLPDGKWRHFYSCNGMPPHACTREIQWGEIFLPSANEDTGQYNSPKSAADHVEKLIDAGMAANTDCRCDFMRAA